MEFLTVGRIVKTIGLKGEVKVYPSTHFRDSRFKKGNHVFLLNEGKEVVRELTIKQRHPNGNMDCLIFDEIDSINEAEFLVGQELFVEKDNSFLNSDEYFYSDLIGCKTFFDNGKEIGIVSKIEEYCSYSTLRVKTSEKDVLIPFVKAYIKTVDLDAKKIVINYIEGLL